MDFLSALNVVSTKIKMSPTTSSSSGVFEMESVRFLHAYTDADADLQADTRNVFLGYEAGNFTMGPAGAPGVLGGRNIGIGYKALQSNTTGWQDTAVGHLALQKNTTGQYNTAVGAYALVETTTGSNNTAVGADALWLNTIGENNTAIGTYALQQNVDGANNMAVGTMALLNNVDGNYNTAIGTEALKTNTTEDYNVGIGYWAMRNAAAFYNVSIGAFTQYATSGNQNTAIGTFANQTLSSGTDTVAVGYGANSTSTTGAHGVYLGSKSAWNLTTGQRNIFIGYQSGYNATTESDNVIIGHDQRLKFTGEDGLLNIQSIIFGRGNTGNNATLSTGKIGIGVVDPQARLHVLSATEQLRLGFDATNYFKTTADANANVVFDLVAASGTPTFTFSDKVIVSSFQFTGGTPGSGKVLTSDGSGNASWTTVSGTGDVVGPASATDNALARYNLTTGKLLQDSNAILADSGDLTLAGNFLTVEKSDAVSPVTINAVNSHVDGRSYLSANGDSAVIQLVAHGSSYTALEDVVMLEAASNADFQIKSDSDIHIYPAGLSSPLVSISQYSLGVDKTSAGDGVSLYAGNNHASGSGYMQIYADIASLTTSVYGSALAAVDLRNVIQIAAVANVDFQIQSDSDIHIYPAGVSTPVYTFTDSYLQVEHATAGVPAGLVAYNSNTGGYGQIWASGDTTQVLMTAWGSTSGGGLANAITIDAQDNDDFQIKSESDIHFYPSGSASPFLTLTATNLDLTNGTGNAWGGGIYSDEAANSSGFGAYTDTSSISFTVYNEDEVGAANVTYLNVSHNLKIISNGSTEAIEVKTDGTLKFAQYTAGYLQTDGSGNVTAGSAPSSSYSIVSLTVADSPYTVLATSGKKIYFIDASGGAVTINVNTAVGNTAELVFIKTDSSTNQVIVDGNGSQTISGSLTKEITQQNSAMTIVSNNANWFII